VVAGVVAGIGEAQSHRTERSAVTLTLSSLTAEITILLGVIPIKGGGIHTDSQEWDTYLKSYIMAAGKLSALPDDPQSGQRLQDVFATILKHPERELSDIPDVETLISEGPTGVDHLLFLAAWPSLRVPGRSMAQNSRTSARNDVCDTDIRLLGKVGTTEPRGRGSLSPNSFVWCSQKTSSES